MIRNRNSYAFPELETLRRMSEAAKGESDRGLALICATTLDELLKQCIEAHLVDHKEVRKLTDGPIAPIGTFAAKILLAFAIGLISGDEYGNLTLIRKIRNEFAHSIEVSFRTPSVMSYCELLKQQSTFREREPVGAREMFGFSAIFMVVVLEGRITEAKEQRLSHQEWKPGSSGDQSI